MPRKGAERGERKGVPRRLDNRCGGAGAFESIFSGLQSSSEWLLPGRESYQVFGATVLCPAGGEGYEPTYVLEWSSGQLFEA